VDEEINAEVLDSRTDEPEVCKGFEEGQVLSIKEGEECKGSFEE
jgi:hypothetical protein